ncbi:MAG TPA: ABC transporter permease [Acidimicrobiia bacterium]|jgi:putative ABC transport system permease protein
MDEPVMTFVGLVAHNVWSKKLRTILTAAAVAIGVMTVVSLGIVTESIKTTAAAVLKTGDADFTVAQNGSSDILSSRMTQAQLTRLQHTAGVESAVGVLLDTQRLNAQNPLFIEVGIAPQDLRPFGVKIVAGRPFDATAANQAMLGWQIAQNLGIRPGATLRIAGGVKTITGLVSTGNVFGDSAGIFPLIPFQAHEREPGALSLAFVKVTKGASIGTVAARIRQGNPSLTTIRTVSQFGRADQSYTLITAADRGATILAVIVGAVIVANTMLLSLFERTREFGILRSVGWSRGRVVALILSEAFAISLLGAAIGVGFAVGVVSLLARLPSLEGILVPSYPTGAFLRALLTAAAVGFLGALYPAVRAGLLRPIAALNHE